VKWIEGGAAGNATALQFDGSGDTFVDVPNPSGLPAGMSARTMAAWFKLRDANLDHPGCIVGYGPNWPGRRCALCVDNDRIEAEFCRQNTAGSWKPDTQWHHLAAVVPEQCSHMNQVLVYLDGVQVSNPIFTFNPSGLPAGMQDTNDMGPKGPQSNTTRGLASFDTASGPLAIGAISGPIWDSSLALKGSVSEVRIYDRALSPAEIAVLHAHPARATSRGLVAGYHLNEGRGKTTTDFSDHGNTGTLQRRDRSWNAPGTRQLRRLPDSPIEEMTHTN